ncbi:hypothetical protein Vretifemale_14532, partial [Volvox reticuliferus]
ASLTDPRLGLMWALPSRWGEWSPSRTDLYLNTWALFLFTQHGPALRSSPSAASWASLESNQVMTWRTAVASQVVRDAEAARKLPDPRPYDDYNTLAWARLALGAQWDPRNSSQAGGNSIDIGFSNGNGNGNDSIATQVAIDLSLRTLVR